MEVVKVVLVDGKRKADIEVPKDVLKRCGYFQALLERWGPQDTGSSELDATDFGVETYQEFLEILRDERHEKLKSMPVLALLNIMEVAYKLVCNNLIEQCTNHIAGSPWNSTEEKRLQSFFKDKECPEKMSMRFSGSWDVEAGLIEMWEELRETSNDSMFEREKFLVFTCKNFPVLLDKTMNPDGWVHCSRIRMLYLELLHAVEKYANDVGHTFSCVLFACNVACMVNQYLDAIETIDRLFRMLPELEQWNIYKAVEMERLPPLASQWKDFSKKCGIDVLASALLDWEEGTKSERLASLLADMNLLYRITGDIIGTRLNSPRLSASIIKLAVSRDVFLDSNQSWEVANLSVNKAADSKEVKEDLEAFLATLPMKTRAKFLKSNAQMIGRMNLNTYSHSNWVKFLKPV